MKTALIILLIVCLAAIIKTKHFIVETVDKDSDEEANIPEDADKTNDYSLDPCKRSQYVARGMRLADMGTVYGWGAAAGKTFSNVEEKYQETSDSQKKDVTSVPGFHSCFYPLCLPNFNTHPVEKKCQETPENPTKDVPSEIWGGYVSN
eukprot:TRINITY_DN28261_c0_g1_i1.p1 TRINITY_DN28261_c0_g1~~TRINITY_DN28261_c0_g1_i1.p1  ORF type:complete len:149 (-),score=23.66 TRINITY_DN28261_c0_g1_i1:32-478(-)